MNVNKKEIGNKNGNLGKTKSDLGIEGTPKIKKRRSNQENETAAKKIRDHFQQSPPMPIFYSPWPYSPPTAPINHFGFQTGCWQSPMPAAPPPSPMPQSPYFFGGNAAAYPHSNLNQSHILMDQSAIAFPSQYSANIIDPREMDSSFPNAVNSPPINGPKIAKIGGIWESGENANSIERIVMREDGTTLMDLSDKPCSSHSLSKEGEEEEIIVVDCKKTKEAAFPPGMAAYWPPPNLAFGFWPFHPFGAHYAYPFPPMASFPQITNPNFLQSMDNLSISQGKKMSNLANAGKMKEKEEIENRENEGEEIENRENEGDEIEMLDRKLENEQPKIKAEFRKKVKLEPKIEKEENGKKEKVKKEGKCSICADFAKTKYYGVLACEGCKGFFLRIVKLGIDKREGFKCIMGKGGCKMSRETRTMCPFCRFRCCLDAGMDKEAVLKRIEEKGAKESGKEGKMKNGQKEACKLIELLNIVCQSFKFQNLHQKSTKLQTMSELDGKIGAFLGTIFEAKKSEIGGKGRKMVAEKGMESFLVIRHVFLDDLPTLKEFLASKIGNADFDGENENCEKYEKSLGILVEKAEKFRNRLSANILQPEEQAILSALAFCHPKNGDFGGGIGAIYAELKNCLHTQMSIRDPSRFNHKAYNAMCQNLEELAASLMENAEVE